MSAKASGSDAKDGVKSRNHQQGNQDRTYTTEQKAAVVRVRRCSPTAFYDILGLEEVKTTVTDVEIKKAYRKISLLTHPDKNGHEHADEAFKMVSRAFGVLGDSEKRSKFDKYGGDPDSRFGAGGGGGGPASPFAGFGGRTPGRGGGGMWEQEISPEEMFNRFFGGGGGFGPFGAFEQQGGNVFFNMGGGPGFRVHQFGGNQPRRRPRDPNAPPDPPPNLRQSITQLLPLLLFLLLPILSNLFTGAGTSGNHVSMRFDTPKSPNTLRRQMPHYKVNYYVNPDDVREFTHYKFGQLDKLAETQFVSQLRSGCQQEQQEQQQKYQAAQGWISVDTVLLAQARNMLMPNCKRLRELGQ